MDHRRLSTGSSFESQVGYSRAVVVDDPAGAWVLVAGTTGFDYDTMTIDDDVVAQCERALATIADVLGEVGGSLDDVVRARYLLPDPDDFPACHASLRRAFARARPAATMMAVGLADPRMRIEIEVTARLAPSGST